MEFDLRGKGLNSLNYDSTKQFKTVFLTTVNKQIPHVIAKGSYYKHLMEVWSEF